MRSQFRDWTWGQGRLGEYIKRERSQVLVIPTTILQHLPNRNLDIQLDRNVKLSSMLASLAWSLEFKLVHNY
ncbi:hypothetical protein HPP92_013984 [Vanilla planifolia]|uniref:Uncharacterized protein n=1 Tax=Vanilla planifolia TaxID=51239 RepID=A0A835UX69_VANPL|nr:hypothetical protein HPP92_013984 [Vanilla planifolia]